jgi:hypothetical protein
LGESKAKQSLWSLLWLSLTTFHSHPRWMVKNSSHEQRKSGFILKNKKTLQTNPKHELALQGILMPECHCDEDGKQCTKGYGDVQSKWRCIY